MPRLFGKKKKKDDTKRHESVSDIPYSEEAEDNEVHLMVQRKRSATQVSATGLANVTLKRTPVAEVNYSTTDGAGPVQRTNSDQGVATDTKGSKSKKSAASKRTSGNDKNTNRIEPRRRANTASAAITRPTTLALAAANTARADGVQTPHQQHRKQQVSDAWPQRAFDASRVPRQTSDTSSASAVSAASKASNTSSVVSSVKSYNGLRDSVSSASSGGVPRSPSEQSGVSLASGLSTASAASVTPSALGLSPAPPPPLPPSERAQDMEFVALYDFNAESTASMSFKKGDHLWVVASPRDNWWNGESPFCDTCGTVPSNYIQCVTGDWTQHVWFHGCISRVTAEYRLRDKTDGTFLVRESDSSPGEHSISVVMQRAAIHFRIYKDTSAGTVYVDTAHFFATVVELVDFYHGNDALGCRLLKTLRKENTGMQVADAWEINRKEITLGKKLGAGQYGEVYIGTCARYGNDKVAVKTFKRATMAPEEFLKEAEVMKHTRHPCLVRLLGVCTLEEPLYIVSEFMCNGCLLDFLRDETNVSSFTSRTLLYISKQTASGMAFLESRNFIHRDLAARNCLVGENLIVKIADFGLSRLLADGGQDGDLVYTAHEGALFPIKWTAPESLKYNKFTTKSDVWAYGVLLWEIYSLGVNPYPGVSLILVLEKLESGYRMPKPEKCETAMYSIMLDCWQWNAEARPTFTDIEARLDETSGASKPLPHTSGVSKPPPQPRSPQHALQTQQHQQQSPRHSPQQTHTQLHVTDVDDVCGDTEEMLHSVGVCVGPTGTLMAMEEPEIIPPPADYDEDPVEDLGNGRGRGSWEQPPDVSDNTSHAHVSPRGSFDVDQRARQATPTGALAPSRNNSSPGTGGWPQPTSGHQPPPATQAPSQLTSGYPTVSHDATTSRSFSVPPGPIVMTSSGSGMHGQGGVPASPGNHSSPHNGHGGPQFTGQQQHGYPQHQQMLHQIQQQQIPHHPQQQHMVHHPQHHQMPHYPQHQQVPHHPQHQQMPHYPQHQRIPIAQPSMPQRYPQPHGVTAPNAVRPAGSMPGGRASLEYPATAVRRETYTMRGGSSGQLPVSGQLCPPQHHPGHRRASSLGSQQLVQQMSPGDSSSGFPGGAAAEDPIRLATGQCKEIIRLGSNVVSRQVDPHSGYDALLAKMKHLYMVVFGMKNPRLDLVLGEMYKHLSHFMTIGKNVDYQTITIAAQQLPIDAKAVLDTLRLVKGNG